MGPWGYSHLTCVAYLHSFAVERGRLDEVAFFHNRPSAHDGASRVTLSAKQAVNTQGDSLVL